MIKFSREEVEGLGGCVFKWDFHRVFSYLKRVLENKMRLKKYSNFILSLNST